MRSSNEVIRIDSQYNSRAVCLVFNNQVVCFQALKSFDKAIRFFDKGNCLYDLFRFNETFTCFSEAIRLNPNHVDSFNVKGIVAYDEAIRIDPNCSA